MKLCVSKKRLNFETVYLKMTWINFDDIWQKYSEDSRIEFACFGFHAFCLLSHYRLSNCIPKITHACCALQSVIERTFSCSTWDTDLCE